MKKSERLLEAIGAIDERHLPDPKEIFDIQNGEDVGEEAELRFSGDYREKRLPLRAAVIPALLTAAAVAVGIALKYYPLPTEPDYTFETTSSLTEEGERTTPSGTTTGTFFVGTELAPLNLIGCYIDEEGHYRIDIDNWQESDDFDLYRKYFFGTWDNAEAAFGKNVPLYVIDDSEKEFLINNCGWRFTGFYKLSENVLAFAINSNAERMIFWIDINYPDIMYADSYNSGRLVCYDYIENRKPNILTKTDAPINEPEENFLSIYKLYEMSRDYGIDFDMLVDIEYDTDIYIGDDDYFVTEDGMVWARLLHDDWYQFYPVYLVSKAPDRLEFKTRIGNIVYDNSEIDAEYTIEKINGEWKRTVLLTLSDGTTVTLETADTETEQPDEQESETVTTETPSDTAGETLSEPPAAETEQPNEQESETVTTEASAETADEPVSEPPAAEDNGSSELIVHKYDIASGSHKDGYFPVEYNGIVYDYDFVNGSYIIDADNNITHRGTYGEEQLDPERELDALLMNFEELEYLGKVDLKVLHWSSEPDMEYADLYKHGDNLIFIFNFFIPTQEVLFCQGYFGFKFTLEEDQRMKEDRSSIKDILAEHGIDPSIFYDAVMFTKGELRHTYEYEEVYVIIK